MTIYTNIGLPEPMNTSSIIRPIGFMFCHLMVEGLW